MEALETITVSTRGQIVIPEAMRKRKKIVAGTKLVIIEDSEKIIIEKEKTFLEALGRQKERDGWEALSSKSISKVWDNPKDDEAWKKY